MMREKLLVFMKWMLWTSVLVLLLFCVETLQEIKERIVTSNDPREEFLVDETKREKCVYTVLAPGSPEFAEVIEYIWYTRYMGAVDGVRKAVESNLAKGKFIRYVNRLERVGTNALFKNYPEWDQIKRLCKEGGRLFYYERKCESSTKAKQDTGFLVMKNGKILFREVLTEMEILPGE